MRTCRPRKISVQRVEVLGVVTESRVFMESPAAVSKLRGYCVGIPSHNSKFYYQRGAMRYSSLRAEMLANEFYSSQNKSSYERLPHNHLDRTGGGSHLDIAKHD